MRRLSPTSEIQHWHGSVRLGDVKQCVAIAAESQDQAYQYLIATVKKEYRAIAEVKVDMRAMAMQPNLYAGEIRRLHHPHQCR